jgi:hypothetical protein
MMSLPRQVILMTTMQSPLPMQISLLSNDFVAKAINSDDDAFSFDNCLSARGGCTHNGDDVQEEDDSC